MAHTVHTCTYTFSILAYTHVLLTDYETKKIQLQESLSSSPSASSAGSTSSLSDLEESNMISVEADYVNMMCDLTQVLEKCSGALKRMMMAYENIVRVKSIKKFKALIKSRSYRGIKSVQEFFRRVGKSWKPTDCSMLHCLVVASRCEEAVIRLRAFKFNHEQRNRSVLTKEEQSAEVQVIPSSTTDSSAKPPELQVPHTTESHPPVSTESVESSPQEVTHDVVSSQPSASLDLLEITAQVAKDDLTVAEYDSMTYIICGALGIPRFLLDLAGIKPGFITIKWTTSMDLLPHIQSTVLDNWDLKMLQEEGVVSIHVGSNVNITVGSHDYWSNTTVSLRIVRIYIIIAYCRISNRE